ncbi:Phosphoprotein [Caenorhabditis elegans]|uniref:Phosphoprotein n=1 Tax=Caenorhabditis elegans TaxID=6239 RepID=O45548_CAEEL|nr:Phosphoprotein [Caenorhabditis elegans]CAB04451.1 Phosphoprotein [Caenorhabditis elegans]|eukprot:NP_499748.1 Uncharacterized protein CELE_F53A2.3 [Caenorhabditis elegans]
MASRETILDVLAKLEECKETLNNSLNYDEAANSNGSSTFQDQSEIKIEHIAPNLVFENGTVPQEQSNSFQWYEEEVSNDACVSSNEYSGVKLCPFNIGFKSYNTPPDQMQQLDKSISDNMACRMNVDFSGIDRLIQHGSEDMRTVGYGMRGMMKLLQIQHEKLMGKKPDDVTTGLKASLVPARFLKEKTVIVRNLTDDADINVNKVFGQLTAQSSSLKNIVINAANVWIKNVVPDEQRKLYSTSIKPQQPQITFPAQLLNGPAGLLVRCLSVTGGDNSSNAVNISLLFKQHVSNLFNHARSKSGITNSRKRKQQSEDYSYN